MTKKCEMSTILKFDFQKRKQLHFPEVNYLNYKKRPNFACDNYIFLNPNLPDPLNFVPFGTMRYSPFDINLISITCILFVYLYFCLFLNKA